MRTIDFVTRLKSNAKYRVLKRRKVSRSTGITSDHEIEFTGLLTNRKYPGRLRRIRYVDSETGKAYTFLTNNFKLAARTIANIYKARWEIELFFKCGAFLNQCLRSGIYYTTHHHLAGADYNPGFFLRQCV